VLLPVFNQVAGLEPIVESWMRALAKLERPVEFIIIDDASTDGTASAAAKLVARHAGLGLLRHDARRGPGAGLRTGLAAATHPLVFVTACDYPYPPADVGKLIEVIDAADLVSGCRTDPVPPWLRRLGAVYRLIMRVVFGVDAERRPGWLGRPAWWRGVIVQWAFGVRVWDPLSAYKLFRRSLLDRILIQSDGEFIHAELLAKANFVGCMMAEVPIGRLPGNFKGAFEPSAPGAEFSRDFRRLFRRPEFLSRPRPSSVATLPSQVADESAAG
jgi:glycosyltransferase involved in cell wall biosynthesis